MGRSRGLWCAWLFFLGGYSILTGESGGWILWVCSLTVPLLLVLLTKYTAGKIRAALGFESMGEKNTEIPGKIEIENKSIFPADRLMCHVTCENMLTGEKKNTTLRLAVPAGGHISSRLTLESRHGGKIRISIQKIFLFDCFGLFRFSADGPFQESVYTLAAPRITSVEAQVVYGESTNMDSDEYSMKKPGNDPSETFGIREYKPGDRVRQIHWKLTEKFDEIMVRDYGLPVQNTILLLLETGIADPQGETDPDARDSLADALLSLSAELAEQQISHSVGWYDHEEHRFCSVEVDNREDMGTLLPELLGAVGGKDPVSVAEHYMEEHEQTEYAHMVIFAEEHRPSLEMLSGQCMVTEILCKKGEEGYDNRDGIRMIKADPETMADTMAYVEI